MLLTPFFLSGRPELDTKVVTKVPPCRERGIEFSLVTPFTLRLGSRAVEAQHDGMEWENRIRRRGRLVCCRQWR